MASSTSPGTSHVPTASLTARAQASTSAGLLSLLSRASVNAANAASKPAPLTAVCMTPKGTASPLGALKPPSLARASSLPEDAAFAPAVCGESARSMAGRTRASVRLRVPSLALPPAALASSAAALAPSPPRTRSAPLACSTRTLPLASTVSLAAVPAPTPLPACSKSGASAVQAKTTPNCLARRARWLSTGRSRATITPRQRGGNSSSPEASLQKIMAPLEGSSRDQASLSASQCVQTPTATPADMAVHKGKPAATFAVCMTSCTSFETWNNTDARSSASTKTETACASIPSAFPRAGTPAYASSNCCCNAKQMRRALSAVAAARCGANGALEGSTISGATAASSRHTVALSSAAMPESSDCTNAC
mmetsp:Transcript_100423/g.284421  ORF Transcript_100423/g.284421 Transcript_100423/m.284421 type:complete len:367 (+) Transcript_100423:716-1816(+)